MQIVNYIKTKINESIKSFSPNNIIYLLIPIILLIILYGSFFPFNNVFIGNWHDIYSNSIYYNILFKNYFATWNPFWSGGFPIYASPSSDKYYFFSAPFYMIFQNFSVVNFILLLHILIAYFAFFKLGSLVTKNNNILLIFSLFFAFSGIILGRIEVGHHLLVYGLAWIPLLYYFFLKIVAFDQATLVNSALFSIVSVFIYFTGDIYHFFYAYMILFIFLLYYLINKQLSRKIVYFIVLSLLLTTLLFSIKAIPDLVVSGSLIRIDTIDPLAGGGPLENDIASFVLGIPLNPIYSLGETTAMVGIIPILFLIIGLIYGKKEITIPSYFAILFSIIWAGGDKTNLYFFHLIPLLINFRVPGRIFGAILPIVLLIGLYGAIELYRKVKNGVTFLLSSEQKQKVLYGVAGVIVVKSLELPFQDTISIETIIPVILIVSFVGLFYFQRATLKNITCFFIISIILNIALILKIDSAPIRDNVEKLLFVAFLLIIFFIYLTKNEKKIVDNHIFCGILIVGIFLMILGNIGFVTTFSPSFEKSPAIDIIQDIKQQPSENTHLVVYEVGKTSDFIDFTYWDVINNILPMRAYSPYYIPSNAGPFQYKVGNINYTVADYFIDNANAINYTLPFTYTSKKVQNISIYKPDHVLPYVFFIRDSQIYPLKIETFSTDQVIVSGKLLPGDEVILKNAYYPGWKINGVDTIPGFLIGTVLTASTDKISFTFDPLDYKIGAFLSGSGIILLIALMIKRKEIEAYFEAYFAKISDEVKIEKKGRR